MTNRPRYVFDTNTVVSALLFASSVPSQALLTALTQGELLVSLATFGELCEVLGRTKFDHYVDRQLREQFLVKLLLRSLLVSIDTSIQECRDPKDDKFLELSISGAASCLFTGDANLLALNPFRGVQIVTPKQFRDLHSTPPTLG